MRHLKPSLPRNLGLHNLSHAMMGVHLPQISCLEPPEKIFTSFVEFFNGLSWCLNEKEMVDRDDLKGVFNEKHSPKKDRYLADHEDGCWSIFFS